MLKRILLSVLAFSLSSLLYAGSIKQIVILGDSLSDNGNLYKVLNIVPKSPPYFEGRFSNGPTWAEHIEKYYYNKSYIDTANYAVGGATSILHSPAHDTFIAPVTITGELYDYLLRSLFTDKSNVLYFIWIGANDYLYEMDPDTNTITTNVVNNITWTITTLMNQGARNFVVMNLPDLSRTVYAHDEKLIERLHAISVMHNTKLANQVKAVQYAHPETKIVMINIYDIFNDLLDHPEKYNEQYHKSIKNLDTACWTGPMMIKKNNNTVDMLARELKTAHTKSTLTESHNFNSMNVAKWILSNPTLAEAYSVGKAYEQGVTPCADADQRVFWDHIHPTATVHDLLAQIIEPNLSSFDL